MKLQFFKILSQSQFMSDFDFFLSTKAKKYAVYSSNFQIIIRRMFYKLS